MAHSYIIRRTAVKIASVAAAARFIGRTQRYHHPCSSLFSAAANNHRAGVSESFFRRAVPSASHHLSTKSDEALLKVIESEIECAEKTMKGVRDVLAGFQFKIGDSPYNTITLTREYQGEQITVDVYYLVNLEENKKEETDEHNEQRSGLVVKISLGKNEHSLGFKGKAYPDKISIDSVSIRYSNSHFAYESDFADLNENLQKAFHNYLEIRGITPSILHEYMINKDKIEDIMWLEDLKKFIELGLIDN